ncbi:MAG: PilZ domain-containing protein [Candidatus Aureabacteria bacterium]|nr:PilZ domain-containing protein [Candidatus Auribacterota bacterium]
MKKYKIYNNVLIGKNSQIGDYAIIGKPPRGFHDGDLYTRIGMNAVIREFTVIYASTRIGNSFQTGVGTRIRENNIIGNDVSIGTNAVLEFSNRIGNGVRIHSNCFLEMATIEDFVFMAPNVVLTDDPHPMGCPKWKECKGGVTIKAYSRIGANTTILPGVIIGRNCLIGAGSVVTENIRDNSVAYGNPATVVKSISHLKCHMGFFDKVYDWPPYTNADTHYRDDRRKFRRLNCPVFVRYGRTRDFFSTINFNDQGVRIPSEKKLKPGQLLNLEILATEDRLIECQAKVIWCSPEINKFGHYEAGMIFINISNEDLEVIKKELET